MKNPHDESAPSQPSRRAILACAGLAGVIVGGLAIGSAMWVWRTWPPERPTPQEIAGAFGPAAGVFSALALAAVAMTVWLQKHQIAVQQHEIKEGREDAALAQEAASKQLALQADELQIVRTQGEAQAKLLAKQSFESTFFQMLRLQEEIRDSVTFNNLKGRDAIRTISERVRDALRRAGGTTHLEVVAHYNAELANWTAEPLGHYFRNLYVTLRYIDNSAGPDAQLYARILRAQLSQSELVLLFYNAHGLFGAEKMLPLAATHRLFKNLDSTRLAAPEHYKWLDTAPKRP